MALPEIVAVLLVPEPFDSPWLVNEYPVRTFQWVWATLASPAESVESNAVPPPWNWMPIGDVPPLAFTVSVKVWVPVPPALAALKVTLDVPVAVGVPEITPVLVLTPKPVGRPVAL